MRLYLGLLCNGSRRLPPKDRDFSPGIHTVFPSLFSLRNGPRPNGSLSPCLRQALESCGPLQQFNWGEEKTLTERRPST